MSFGLASLVYAQAHYTLHTLYRNKATNIIIIIGVKVK